MTFFLAEKILRVAMKTSDRKWAESDSVFKIEVCQDGSLYKCCSFSSDKPHTNDLERNQMDIYTGRDLSSCRDFPVDSDVKVTITMRRSDTDGWYPQYIKIYTENSRPWTCNINTWIDTDQRGYSHKVTRDCSQ